MCMKPVLTINIPEIENGSFDLYTDGYQENGQLFGNADHYFIKQTEVAKLLGYSAGNVKIQFEGAIKCPDSSTRPFVFIAIPLVIDFLDALPTTGNRRKNSRIIESYIEEINTIFRNSWNPVSDIREAFDATDPVDRPADKDSTTKLVQRINELQKEINNRGQIIQDLSLMVEEREHKIKHLCTVIAHFINDIDIESIQQEDKENESC